MEFSAFTSALNEVMRLEITLRRVVRFELMRQHGRKWISNADNLFHFVEDRLSREKRAGLYTDGASELSYLTLNELAHHIFKEEWQSRYREIFCNQNYIFSDINRHIIPLRNKLAHFRQVTKMDLVNARASYDLLNSLREYYRNESFHEFYISSEPEYASEWTESETVNSATHSLEKYQAITVWETLSEIDSMRRYGFHIGAGIWCEHFFLEVYSDSNFQIEKIDSFFCKNKDIITLVCLSGTKVRFFISLQNEAKEISRLLRSLGRLFSQETETDDSPKDPDVNEYFVGPNLESTVSFAM